jgi:hypothetical protein
MPYRDQPIEEVCNLCHETALRRCRRCGAPLCGEHAPARRRRCTRCEERFAAGRDRAVAALGALEILVVLGLGVVALAGPGLPDSLPPLMTLGGVAALLGLPPLLLPQIRRTLFLLSRRPWRALDE